MKILVVILLCIIPFGVAFSQQIVKDEIRMSIFFGGGSYFVDDEQATELIDWLDSIPNLLEKYGSTR
jgi:hypothetical protein